MASEQNSSLLLLPLPPQPPSRASLSAAYRPSLLAVLSRVKDPTRSSVLIVAIVCPVLNGASPKKKSLSWAAAQSLIAGVYSLIAIVCAEQGIATDVDGGPHSVDSRVILVDHHVDRRFGPDFVAAIEPNNTTVVDLPTFASAYHPWNHIFHVNSEQGYRTLSSYLKFAEGKQTILQSQLVVVEAGLSMNLEGANTKQTETSPLYPVVCLGGTFDHLHPGHKLLIMAGVLLLKVPDKDSGLSCRLVLGVTGDKMLENKKYGEFVQSWHDRSRYALDFVASLLELDESGWKKKSGPVPTLLTQPGHLNAKFRNGTITVECVEFQDLYGPTISMPEIEALVYSGETRSGGKAVNDERVRLGMKPLDTYEVNVLDARDMSDEEATTEDFTNKISSTAIRQQKAEAAAAAAAAAAAKSSL